MTSVEYVVEQTDAHTCEQDNHIKLLGEKTLGEMENLGMVVEGHFSHARGDERFTPPGAN